MQRVRNLIIVIYILVDVLILTLSFFLPHSYYYRRIAHDLKIHMAVYAFWILMTVFMFYSSQLYFTVREVSVWREIKRTIRAFALATLTMMVLLFFLKIQTFPRTVVAANFILGLTSLILWRVSKRFFVRHLVSSGFNNVNVLIVGAGKSGRELSEKLQSNSYLGLRVVGYLDDHIPVGQMVKNVIVLGTTADFESIVRKYFIDQVYITIPSERKIVSQIGFCAKLLGVSVQIIPDHFSLESDEIRLHQIDNIHVLEYHSVSPNYQMMIVKRTMDVVVSLLSLTLLSPLFFLIAIVIKQDSPGPVFYASKRWGRKGRLFQCYKFRSMINSADAMRAQLREANGNHPVFKMKDDPRITSVGKWLRKYSLDELPQLWNVLRGDMSLVGPRPLPEDERVDDHKLKYLNRLSIKPGLTCLWQIRGRSDLPFERWMKLDDYYIRNWSPRMDLGILFRTIPAVFKGKGAY